MRVLQERPTPFRILEEKQLKLLGAADRYIASATEARELGVLKVPDGHGENTRIQALKNRWCDVEGHVWSLSWRVSAMIYHEYCE